MSLQSKEYPGQHSKVKSCKSLGASYKFIVDIGVFFFFFFLYLY